MMKLTQLLTSGLLIIAMTSTCFAFQSQNSTASAPQTSTASGSKTFTPECAVNSHPTCAGSAPSCVSLTTNKPIAQGPLCGGPTFPICKDAKW